MEVKNNKNYQNYIGIEWSQEVVVVARMSSNSTAILETVSMKPSVEQLRDYLIKLRGSKIITIEETTTSHWLYVELYKVVDKIIICDPYRNSLLKDGPKNDKRDAGTLCLLLRHGLLKEVYHSDDKLFELRKFVSIYTDFVKASVRLKNQQSALYRSVGKKVKQEKHQINFEGDLINFVSGAQSEGIIFLKQIRDKFEHEMDKIARNIAKSVYGVMKYKTDYRSYQWRENKIKAA